MTETLFKFSQLKEMDKLGRFFLLLFLEQAFTSAEKRIRVVYNNVQPFIYINKSQLIAYGKEYAMMNYIAQSLNYQFE